MSTYYVAGIPFSDELYHHGIKGQKWGVRRFQNSDGSLTSAGKARYGENGGGMGNKKPSMLRKIATGDVPVIFLGSKRIEDYGEKLSKKAADNARLRGNKNAVSKFKETHNVAQNANIAREKYISNASTGKLVAQRLLLGNFGSSSYQTYRGSGVSTGKAVAAAIVSSAVPFGYAINYGMARAYAGTSTKRKATSY